MYQNNSRMPHCSGGQQSERCDAGTCSFSRLFSLSNARCSLLSRMTCIASLALQFKRTRCSAVTGAREANHLSVQAVNNRRVLLVGALHRLVKSCGVLGRKRLENNTITQIGMDVDAGGGGQVP
jgi:hypothetical protein